MSNPARRRSLSKRSTICRFSTWTLKLLFGGGMTKKMSGSFFWRSHFEWVATSSFPEPASIPRPLPEVEGARAAEMKHPSQKSTAPRRTARFEPQRDEEDRQVGIFSVLGAMSGDERRTSCSSDRREEGFDFLLRCSLSTRLLRFCSKQVH